MTSKTKRKQSLIDRINRFNQGCCPIHGLGMGQIDGWYYPENEKPFTIVGCPRRDCKAQVKAYDVSGPWEMMPECVYLLDEDFDLSSISPFKKSNVKQSLPRIKQSEIMMKTDGRCYYCGVKLITAVNFTIDHIVPQVEGGERRLENLVPACKQCNSAKGSKSLEEFRFHRSMQKFSIKNGVTFMMGQVEFLDRLGFKLDIPNHVFWFEDHLGPDI